MGQKNQNMNKGISFTLSMLLQNLCTGVYTVLKTKKNKSMNN